MEGYYPSNQSVPVHDANQRPVEDVDQNFSSEVIPTYLPHVPDAYNQIYDQSAYSGFDNQYAQNPVYDNGVSPGFAFNGHMLYASARTVPDEFVRVPTGTSIAEPGSILDQESGRTYHNHGTGKYFFPNDAVSMCHSKRAQTRPRC